MALHGEVKVNARVIAEWSAVRKRQAYFGDDDANEYACEYAAEHAVPLRFRLTHRYSEGAAVLASKILAEAARRSR